MNMSQANDQHGKGLSQTVGYTIRSARYLSITDRCTLACNFCPKHNDSMAVQGFDLTMEHRPEVEEIIAAIGDPTDFSEVVFCGFGEPTLRLKVLLEVASWVKARGGRVRINTDGLANAVHKRNVLPELVGKVDALSVSLNGQNEAIYNQHCEPAMQGSFQAVLDFLALAPTYISEVTVTAVDGLEGLDIDACQQLAEQRGAGFRRRELGLVG